MCKRPLFKKNVTDLLPLAGGVTFMVFMQNKSSKAQHAGVKKHTKRFIHYLKKPPDAFKVLNFDGKFSRLVACVSTWNLKKLGFIAYDKISPLFALECLSCSVCEWIGV